MTLQLSLCTADLNIVIRFCFARILFNFKYLQWLIGSGSKCGSFYMNKQRVTTDKDVIENYHINALTLADVLAKM